MGRFKSSLDGLTQLRRLTEMGGMPAPAWLAAREQEAAEQLRRGGAGAGARRKPRRLEFPEDRLVQSFIARNPQVKDIPVDLGSWEPHVARRFAWLQLKAMEGGATRAAAYDQALAALQRAGVSLHPQRQSPIEAQQRAEEVSIVGALEARVG